MFEHYGVNHTVSELKKEIEGKVKLTLPCELKRITSTFVVEGAQTIENEEYEETIKDVKELSTEGSITTEPNGDVPLQNQDESGDDDGKKEAPPGPKELEKKYEWVDVVKKRKRPKRTDLTVISPEIHRAFFGVVHMQFINLLCFVYLVDGTTLKDQINIKVPTFLRNVCEEEHAEGHTQVVDLCNTQEARNYETPEANVYELHLFGIIDMLGKLQKKLDAELRDAQEDENNAADPIFFNSVRGAPWYLVPGFVKPHTEECRARIIQAMTEDESLSSRDPQDDDDIIMDEFCMLEQIHQRGH